MKKRDIIVILLIVIVLIGIIVGLLYHFRDRKTYTLTLPQLENLKSISLKQSVNEKVISNHEEMKDVLEVINGTKRITQKESIQDEPVNVENEIKVDFNFVEEGTSTIFIYKKNNNYYIEQPYNGVYRISADEYNSVEKYVR